MHPNITLEFLELARKSLEYSGTISFLSATYFSYSSRGIHLRRPATVREVLNAIQLAKIRNLEFIFIYY